MVKTKMRTRTKVLIVVGVILALLLASGGVVLAGGISAAGSDTIYPNVTINGIDVGGLTMEEAADKLADAVTEDLSDKTVVVRFPGDSVLEVTAEQAGLKATGQEAAELAYEYGRSGGSVGNAFTYLRCRMGGVELEPSAMMEADPDMVRAVVAEAEDELNAELMASSYEITDEALLVTKGRLGLIFDEERLVEMICDAFTGANYTTIDYEAETKDPESIDLQAIYDDLYSEPENAIYDKETDSISMHVEGVSFDLEEAQRLIDLAENGTQVTIPLVRTEPEITKTYLESVLFADLLCSSSTELTNNANRNTNIELAANAINGTILNPGEQFDFNTVVGQRTREKGYLEAGAYAGTENITEVGGGICQVSSTIYHALLHTDLQVDNRINHSLTVTYLPLGMDAAVSWGGPEFAFTNNTEYPIKIEAYRDGLTVKVAIYGTDTSEYTIQPRQVYIGQVAFNTTYKDAPSLPTGETRTETSGLNGHVTETYKDYYDAAGNVVKSELVDRSNYSPRDAVILRGTGAVAVPDPTPDTSSDPDPGTSDPDPVDPPADGE